MKRLLIGMSALALTVIVAPSAVSAEQSVVVRAKSAPKVAMCVGAGQSGGLSFLSKVATKPPTIIVDCPAGGDDNPIGTTPDTFISGITWSQWGAKRAVGTGTLTVPSSECIYTSPKDGTPDQVKTMCETSGEVGNVITQQTYPAKIVLSKPAKFKKGQETFTKVTLTFPNGGPDGKTSATYTPPRNASE